MSVEETFETLRNILLEHIPPLRISSESSEHLTLNGNVETMQGRQKVDGIFFATIQKKEKDIRLYFFPVYTHEKAFSEMSVNLRKLLKGKSCFHIKKLDAPLKEEIQKIIMDGVREYKNAGLLA